jgi:hypothetical protein
MDPLAAATPAEVQTLLGRPWVSLQIASVSMLAAPSMSWPAELES